MNDNDILRGSFGCLLATDAWIILRAFTHPSGDMTEFATFAVVITALLAYTFRHQLRRKK